MREAQDTDRLSVIEALMGSNKKQWHVVMNQENYNLMSLQC